MMSSDKHCMEIQLRSGNEVLADGGDIDEVFDADEEGFNLAFDFYVMKYVTDPNGRDTMLQALNTRAFRFGIGEQSVAKHIRRLRTIFRYVPRLPGDAVVAPAQVRHSVMNSFPK